MLTDQNRLRFQVRINTNPYFVDSSVQLQTGTWQYVVGTYDGSSLKVYVNGALTGSNPASGTIDVNSMPVWVGKGTVSNNDATDGFRGTIDNLRIYSKGLTQVEVVQRYNSEKSGFQ